MADLVIAIIGTPGVGKTTFAKKLSKAIKAKLIDANAIINAHKLYSSIDKYNTKIVKMRELSKKLNEIVSKEKGVVIIEGHILSDIKIKGAVAIVLREHLKKLLARLKARHYAKEKIEDNIISEATDYCGINASRHYSKVFEFYSSDKDLMKKALNAIKSNPKNASIELLEELKDVIEIIK